MIKVQNVVIFWYFDVMMMWCWDDVKCWGLWCCDVDCWVLWFYDDVKLSVMMLWWFNDECWDDEKCCDDMMMWCWVLCWDDVECKIGRVYNWKSEGCRIGMCDFMDYIGSKNFWIFWIYPNKSHHNKHLKKGETKLRYQTDFTFYILNGIFYHLC